MVVNDHLHLSFLLQILYATATPWWSAFPYLMLMISKQWVIKMIARKCSNLQEIVMFLMGSILREHMRFTSGSLFSMYYILSIRKSNTLKYLFFHWFIKDTYLFRDANKSCKLACMLHSTYIHQVIDYTWLRNFKYKICVKAYKQISMLYIHM